MPTKTNASPAFPKNLADLKKRHAALFARKNKVDTSWYNGLYERYVDPVVTAAHVPLEWRYDLNPKSNPFLLERQGINAAFNAGAIEHNGKVLIYYASSDTRLHVATSSVARLLDYVKNTPADGLRSAACVQTRLALIRQNQSR